LKGSAGELDLNELHKTSASIEATLKNEIKPEIDKLTHFYQTLDNCIKEFSKIVNQV